MSTTKAHATETNASSFAVRVTWGSLERTPEGTVARNSKSAFLTTAFAASPVPPTLETAAAIRVLDLSLLM